MRIIFTAICLIAVISCAPKETIEEVLPIEMKMGIEDVDSKKQKSFESLSVSELFSTNLYFYSLNKSTVNPSQRVLLEVQCGARIFNTELSSFDKIRLIDLVPQKIFLESKKKDGIDCVLNAKFPHLKNSDTFDLKSFSFSFNELVGYDLKNLARNTMLSVSIDGLFMEIFESANRNTQVLRHRLICDEVSQDFVTTDVSNIYSFKEELRSWIAKHKLAIVDSRCSLIGEQAGSRELISSPTYKVYPTIDYSVKIIKKPGRENFVEDKFLVELKNNYSRSIVIHIEADSFKLKSRVKVKGLAQPVEKTITLGVDARSNFKSSKGSKSITVAPSESFVFELFTTTVEALPFNADLTDIKQIVFLGKALELGVFDSDARLVMMKSTSLLKNKWEFSKRVVLHEIGR